MVNSCKKPIVIAHRGASGYLPEHSLASKAAAHVMGADFLEQDIVLTKDAVPIVLHDIYLEQTTNVADIFPNRQQSDGHFYVLDFELEEIRKLSMHERYIITHDSRRAPLFENRFPYVENLFRITTLKEEIAMISGLNQSRGRTAGIYLELKSPRLHSEAGYDIADVVMNELMQSEYRPSGSPAFIQCFDDATLKYIKFDLKMKYPLIQLIGENIWQEDSGVDYEALKTATGLQSIAAYADGIGPWIEQIFLGLNKSGKPIASELVTNAREFDLLVHPYTFRKDELPEGIQTFEQLLSLFLVDQKVDGIFTDFPDIAIDFIKTIQK